ncbi:MAG: hypothetical protein ACPGGK_11595 [Pikeienuella sp.]
MTNSGNAAAMAANLFVQASADPQICSAVQQAAAELIARAVREVGDNNADQALGAFADLVQIELRRNR